MRKLIDVSRVTFTVTLAAQPKTDGTANARQKTERDSGRPLSEVLAEASGLDPSSLSTQPDVGEAGVQVDDVLAAHRTLTEGQQ